MTVEITREQFLESPALWVRESWKHPVRVVRSNGSVAMTLTGATCEWDASEGRGLAEAAFQAATSVHDEAEEMARRGVM